jgi:NADH:ubiquinone oxidoreductase subunit E
MSLPIVGSPKTSREPTHQVVDFDRSIRIAGDVEAALAERGAQALTPELVEEIADELGVRASHIYAAMAMMTKVPCAADADVRVELCVGNCQKWGALELLDRVLDVHGQQRADHGEASFGVVARSCLDRCADAAVVLIHTPDGTAGITAATVAALDEALAQLPGA